MEKKLFVKILDGLIKKYSFIKKGGLTWNFDAGNLIKIIKVVKSRHGNYYQVNYGYVLKNIELNGLEMHIFNSLGSIDKNENARISELLDLDSPISDEERQKDLEKFITNIVLERFVSVSSEDGVYNELKNRATLNDIPLIVKRYFNITT